MKKIKYYLFLFLAAGITSCSLHEDLVDVPTPGQIRTESDVKTLIAGSYSFLSSSPAFKFQGMSMLVLCADDIYSPGAGDFTAYANRTYDGNNTAPFWNQLFFTIGNANNLIDAMDRLNLDAAFERRVYGEAYFLRAFAYYYLVRLYGGVPLRTESLQIDSQFYLPRNTVDEVYAQIFKDFKAAAERLPLQTAVSVDETGRATKGAAQAILAQAYLTYGNKLALKGGSGTAHYQQASLYADSVINSGAYSLLDNYADLFDVGKENGAYREVIFGVRFSRDNQRTGQNSKGSEFASRFGVSQITNTSGGDNTGALRPMHWFFDYYNNSPEYKGDYRIERTFVSRGLNVPQNKYFVTYPNIPSGTDGTIATPVLAKYQDPQGKDARNNENDFFVIRLAEVYLIKAEAENELNGPTTAAYTAFNQVRTRARKANGTARTIPANLAAGLSKSQFRMKVFDERGLELTGEGQRWFDLVRMQSPVNAAQTMFEYQFLTVLPAKPKVLPTYMAAQRKWSNTDAVYADALKVTVRHLLFPVPSVELLQNPAFGPQNPGW
ncbi:hypothetical protein C7T94_09525 [Pedobacter yulinensis]|uniref:RagB/SusD family nutrient uptake outer membrane protein n=1 Tax=Pedobacter yulinensis TaxID=2126353 RepID=A0A2T3HK81_9SPHI|nr:RagB/SusD family nutrient uptake outer membrane protein [Pedobacter yulinensis]PST82865.1 hypothetical protein C7T94_09525 [Pedobacter yulinensis]